MAKLDLTMEELRQLFAGESMVERIIPLPAPPQRKPQPDCEGYWWWIEPGSPDEIIRVYRAEQSGLLYFQRFEDSSCRLADTLTGEVEGPLTPPVR